jgi:8-oxo-dGTP pyrophosphatase MutT (NUDIX family)
VERWIRCEEKYRGSILSLWVGEVQLENGEVYSREVTRHNGGVAIVPVIDDSVILVQQFRIAVERDMLELPAGKLEKGELPEICAHRELEEEIGYRAGNMVLATSYYSSVGFTDEKMHIFLGFQLRKVAQNLDSDERIQIVHIPIAEIGERLARNEFEDAKTIIGLRELLAYRK